jgi:2,4'-dihydroxyacetophenone dioxygenase
MTAGQKTASPKNSTLFLTIVFSQLVFIPTFGAAFIQPLAVKQLQRVFIPEPEQHLNAAPEGALPDIVIPSIFDFNVTDDEDSADPRVWVPQTPCLSFRPLCFCTSQGYYVNLLKFTGGGVLGRHRHSSPVHALTLKGSWGYREHGWHASPGTYVFEPPGETHTLIVDEDCDEMVALFHVTGSLLYVNEETGEVIGFDDVFTKLEKARDWYEECGLGRDYANQFIR